MKHKKIARALLCGAMLAATAGLVALSGSLARHIAARGAAAPPGVHVAERKLITVWLAGDLPGAAAWLRKQAGAYGRQTAGVSVWLRAVSRADLESMADAPPDVLVFTADTPVLPEQVQSAQALCLSGYALVERTRQAAVTPAPRSLFGVTCTPAPRATPLPAQPEWPQKILADNAFGALALGRMRAPYGAELVDAGEVLRRFMAQEDAAALLSVRQAQAAATQGVGFRVVAAAPATDLVLYGALTAQAEPAAEAFLHYLLSDAAQAALSAHDLLPARADVRVYGPDRPLLQALEAALDGGWRAPPFTWAVEKRDILLTAQALYEAGRGNEDTGDTFLSLSLTPRVPACGKRGLRRAILRIATP